MLRGRGRSQRQDTTVVRRPSKISSPHAQCHPLLASAARERRTGACFRTARPRQQPAPIRIGRVRSSARTHAHAPVRRAGTPHRTSSVRVSPTPPSMMDPRQSYHHRSRSGSCMFASLHAYTYAQSQMLRNAYMELVTNCYPSYVNHRSRDID